MDNSGYMNPEDALKRVGGNEGLYVKLLGRFVEGNQYEEFIEVLQSGDMEEAARKIHAIKGVVANLSLEKLHEDTIALEKAIKSGEDYEVLLMLFKNSYAITLEKIAEYTK